jgi:CheY-like chemotaxis protein
VERPVSTPRVLHIDDSPDFRCAFKSILEQDGIAVLGRRDTREAADLLPGLDFDFLVVDRSGFEYAREPGRRSEGLTLIVLSSRPETANLEADAAISKSDSAWPTKVLELIRARSDDAIPPMLERSNKAFERALDDLLKTHYRQWVAYHGDEQVGFGRSQTALFDQCLRRGFKEDQFVVRSVEPLIADEDLVFPAES